jgi:hypothetical protein
MKFGNHLSKIIMLLLILVLLISLYFITSNKEGYSTDNVVFIIPSTSRKMDYKDIESCSLVKNLYASLEKLDIKKYTFVIGIDDDDEFYNKNIEALKRRLPDNFKFHFLNNYDKSYVCIVNQLATIAINQYNAEYLYVYADDLIVYEVDYIRNFVSWFKAHENLGLGWGIDQTNEGICTHPFVHKNHVNTLGYFYPSAIKNWYCDDWVTQVYQRLNRVTKSAGPVITNAIVAADAQRYDIVNVEEEKLNELVIDAVSKLSNTIIS